MEVVQFTIEVFTEDKAVFLERMQTSKESSRALFHQLLHGKSARGRPPLLRMLKGLHGKIKGRISSEMF